MTAQIRVYPNKFSFRPQQPLGNRNLCSEMQHLRPQERESYILFRRQYLQLLDTDSLAFPASDCLRNESFQSIMYEGIFKPGILAYPPQARYQIRVLKELVLRVEKSIVDPEEDVRRVSFLYFESGFRPMHDCRCHSISTSLRSNYPSSHRKFRMSSFRI